ncbi:hypothetical protein LINPERPRIM_LOCUS3250 [Linum perenne]
MRLVRDGTGAKSEHPVTRMSICEGEIPDVAKRSSKVVKATSFISSRESRSVGDASRPCMMFLGT